MLQTLDERDSNFANEVKKQDEYLDWYKDFFAPNLRELFGDSFDIHEVWNIPNGVLKDNLKQKLATVDEKTKKLHEKAFSDLRHVAYGKE